MKNAKYLFWLIALIPIFLMRDVAKGNELTYLSTERTRHVPEFLGTLAKSDYVQQCRVQRVAYVTCCATLAGLVQGLWQTGSDGLTLDS